MNPTLRKFKSSIYGLKTRVLTFTFSHMQYLIMYRISTKAPRIQKRKTRRMDVIRISGHRRDWRKKNKEGKWKMKKEGTKEMGIKR
jgi:hypothetical protein